MLVWRPQEGVRVVHQRSYSNTAQMLESPTQPVQAIGTLVSRMLQHLVARKTVPFSREIVAAYLFSARQMYSSHEARA